MGSIRTLLAIAVVFSHTSGFVFVGGQLAVQLFYMISGFLISYILVECKSYDRPSKFYVNRILRLYPIYWLVALATLGFYAIALISPSIAKYVQIYPDFVDVYKNVGGLGASFLVFANAFLIGQDWIMFSGVEDGALKFVSDFKRSDVPVWHGLVVPQAWTLGVELSFYAIAPFVVTRIKVLYGLLAFSILVRLILIVVGVGFSDPWTYRFFPAELVFFVLGSLAHQIIQPFYRRVFDGKFSVISGWVTIFVFLYCALFSLLPYRKINALLLVIVFFVSLPFLFEFQAGREWDRRIGDLSYPVYITHLVLVAPVTGLVYAVYSGAYAFEIAAVCVVVVTLLASLLINKFVGIRVELFRSKIRRSMERSGQGAVSSPGSSSV